MVLWISNDKFGEGTESFTHTQFGGHTAANLADENQGRDRIFTDLADDLGLGLCLTLEWASGGSEGRGERGRASKIETSIV